MKYPNIISASDIVRDAQHTQAGLSDGRYVPARSLGWPSFTNRVRATWLVFTGKADAVTWEGQ